MVQRCQKDLENQGHCARLCDNSGGGNGVDGTGQCACEVGCFENLVVAGRIFFFAWDFRVKNARDCMTDGMRETKRDPSGQILLP